jgi:hypothetical protein
LLDFKHSRDFLNLMPSMSSTETIEIKNARLYNRREKEGKKIVASTKCNVMAFSQD